MLDVVHVRSSILPRLLCAIEPNVLVIAEPSEARRVTAAPGTRTARVPGRVKLLRPPARHTRWNDLVHHDVEPEDAALHLVDGAERGDHDPLRRTRPTGDPGGSDRIEEGP
ncbi:hypothetical protein GCM10023108_09770 [Saccharopolyspora hordei]